MRNTFGLRQQISRRPTADLSPRLQAAALSVFLGAAAIGLPAGANAQTPSACATRGGWVDVKTGQSIDRGEFFRDLVAKSSVVLLPFAGSHVVHAAQEFLGAAAAYRR
jgi:hypothetical protein